LLSPGRKPALAGADVEDGEVRKLPKIKTHKSTAKRFKYSGSGKLMRTKIGKSHLRRKKSRRVRVMFSKMHEVEDKGTQKRVRKLAPYLGKK